MSCIRKGVSSLFGIPVPARKQKKRPVVLARALFVDIRGALFADFSVQIIHFLRQGADLAAEAFDITFARDIHTIEY